MAQEIEEPSALEQPAQSTVVTAGGHKQPTDWVALIGGLLFWFLVIGGWLSVVYWPDHVTLLLNVSQTSQPNASGKVLFEGKPVTAGNVRITVENAQTNRYLSSQVVSVDNGTFTSGATQLIPKEDIHKALRVVANFFGTTPGDAKKEIEGETVLYINTSPPIVKRYAGWGLGVGVGVMVALLMFLFTVHRMDRGPARLLFAITYFMIILALTVPLAGVILVSQNQYMISMMSNSPIGLVKATASGIRDPQWLLNIGGLVVPAPESLLIRKSEDPKGGTQVNAPNPAASEPPTIPAGLAAGAPTQPPPVSPGAVDAGNADKSKSSAAAQTAPDGEPAFNARTVADNSAATIVGGLAIPFYVVMLALLGAAINMARTVPKIQQDYDNEQLAKDKLASKKEPFASKLHLLAVAPFQTLKAGSEAPKDDKEVNVAFRVRKGLIENYMSLLSAPFLAIAVYYLLQVVANEVSQPILVVMAFATGLKSELIVGSIMKFASDKFPGGDQSRAQEQEQKPEPEPEPEQEQKPEPEQEQKPAQEQKDK